MPSLTKQRLPAMSTGGEVAGSHGYLVKGADYPATLEWYAEG